MGAPALAQTRFREVSAEAGLGRYHAFRSASGHAFGICWTDINNDGWPDIAVSAGKNQYVALFINKRDGTFMHGGHLLPPLTGKEYIEIRAADVDNDGDQDLLVQTDADSHSIPGPNPPAGPPSVFLKNLLVENGGVITFPLFEDVSVASGIQSDTRDFAASFLDYDQDGWLDLYVGHFVHSNVADPANQDFLFHNDGTGHFVDVTVASGVSLSATPNLLSASLAVIGAHLDEDMLPDIYVTGNMYMNSEALDLLWLNQGNGQFTYATTDSAGFGDDTQSPMGIDTADINHDGYWDLYASDIYNTSYDEEPLGNPLYLGQGGGTFSDNVAPDWGAAPPLTSWGVNFFDVDQDSWDDLFVGTNSDNKLLMNQAGTGFNQTSMPGKDAGTRGSAVADYDQDGDLDLAIANEKGGIELFENIAVKGNWLILTLQGVASNRDAIGVRANATVNGVKLMRQLKGGTSVHSQDENLIHFGLGGATTITTLEVLWPSGLIETKTNVPVNQRIHLVEGDWSDPDDDGDVGEADNCPWTPNAGQEDGDDDGIGDACDDCPEVSGEDVDGDGKCPDADTCPLDPNNDVDSDGLCANVDNCPLVANAEQTDSDGDGYGDACDPCPLDALNDWERDGECADVDLCPDHSPNDDRDGDGICTWSDNCRDVANPLQEDADADAVGDACDGCFEDDDRDLDGICSADDNCFRISNVDQLDEDHDGLGDVCDPCLGDPTNDCAAAETQGDEPAAMGDGDGDSQADGDGDGDSTDVTEVTDAGVSAGTSDAGAALNRGDDPA